MQKRQHGYVDHTWICVLIECMINSLAEKLFDIWMILQVLLVCMLPSCSCCHLNWSSFGLYEVNWYLRIRPLISNWYRLVLRCRKILYMCFCLLICLFVCRMRVAAEYCMLRMSKCDYIHHSRTLVSKSVKYQAGKYCHRYHVSEHSYPPI